MGGVAGPHALEVGLAPRGAGDVVGLEVGGGDLRRPVGLQAGPSRLDDLQAHAVGGGEERPLDLGAGVRGHRRLLLEDHVELGQRGRGDVQILDDERDVIDRASHRRRRHAQLVLGNEHPDVAEPQGVDLPPQARRLAAEHVAVPREGRVRVLGAQLDVVEAQGVVVLDHLDAGAPGVEDVAELVQAGHVAPGRPVGEALQPHPRAPHPDRLELGHLGRQVRIREADVVDPGALGAAEGRLHHEGQLGAAAVGGVGPVGHGLAVEMPDVPAHALGRARGGDVNVVEAGLLGRRGHGGERRQHPGEGNDVSGGFHRRFPPHALIRRSDFVPEYLGALYTRCRDSR